MSTVETKKPSLLIIVFTCLGVMFLLVHFTLTSVFSLREFAPHQLQSVAERYTFPTFHQDWKLFAPDLAMYNAELEYRFAHSGQWNNWQDVRAAHGFDNDSRMERVEQGFNHQLAWQATNNLYAKDGVAQFDRIMTSTAYKNALYFAVKMHERHSSQKQYDSLQIRLNFRFNPAPGATSQAENTMLEFPIYKPQP